MLRLNYVKVFFSENSLKFEFQRFVKTRTVQVIVVKGLTSSGPNPKNNLKPKLGPKNSKVKLGLKNVYS